MIDIDLEKILEEYDKLPFYFSDEENKQLEDSSIEEFWNKIGDIKDFSNNVVFKNITKLADVILVLPHSNAVVERVLSL